MDPATLRALPKAELHQHLDGSVRPATAVELAGEIGLSLTLDEARTRMVGPPRCVDQAELLGFFDLPIAVLQTADALRRAARELVEDLAADGITYAELRWAPRLHLERGMSVDAVIEAVAAGVSDATAALAPASPTVALIVTAMRSHPPAANAELARTGRRLRRPGRGIRPRRARGGVAGSAARDRVRGRPRGRAVAHLARRRGRRERHASARCSTSACRGSRTAYRPSRTRLSSRSCRRRDITLDLCPTSNVQAGVAAGLAEHPLAVAAPVGRQRHDLDRRPHRHRHHPERRDGARRRGPVPDAGRADEHCPQRVRSRVRPAAIDGAGARGGPRRRGKPGAIAPSAEPRAQQVAHRGRIVGDRVGDELAGQGLGARAVRDAGQHQDRCASRAMCARHVRVGVVADDDACVRPGCRSTRRWRETSPAPACR